MANSLEKINPLINNRLLDGQQEVQSPFDKLPVEIVLHIFSYLKFEDLWRASQVCKEWYQCAGDFLPRVRQLCSEEMVGQRVLHMSPMGFCFVLYRQSNAKSTLQIEEKFPYLCQFWSLKTDTHGGTGTLSLENFIGCNHYIMCRLRNTLAISSFFSSAESTELAIAEQCSHFSINEHGFTYIQDYSTDHATLHFISINQMLFPQMMRCQLSDCLSPTPVALLHNDWLIYTALPGELRVRNANIGGAQSSLGTSEAREKTIKNLSQVGEDLVTPEIKKVDLSKITQAEKLKLHSCYSISSILVSGSILVSLSTQNLLVWDLNTREVIKTFPPLDEHLDALEGFTLLTHTSKTITLWDLKGEKITKKAEWKNSSTNCKNPAGLYHNKVYILSEKDDTGTLTVYDFSRS